MAITKNQRREVRISDKDDDLLVEAAGIVGVSVSEFILSRALEDAEVTVAAHHEVVLDTDAYDRFLAVLDAPAQAIPALASQARRARRLKHVD